MRDILSTRMWIISIYLLFYLCYTLAAQSYESVTVTTEQGPVKGFSIRSQYSAYDKSRINLFLGIPYAKRLSQYTDWRREFRFKKPELPYWSGTWDATYYRPACPQHLWYVRETIPNFPSDQVSEDCLYLNIFTPRRIDEVDSNNPTLYPVMVFIHGGGFMMGTSQQYPGIFLAERGIVVVTVNYRLGPLGFLSTGDQNSPGNYGLWDQRYALDWIKRNIRNFRGNPNIITLAGQSTGAACVGLHLLSPRSVNFFHRAIMQSGSDRSQWSIITSLTEANFYAKELARELGCPTGDSFRLVQCLQLYRTDSEIVNASTKIKLQDGSVGNPWGPVVDGPVSGVNFAFLPDTPELMRQQGRFQKLVVMGGLNKDDGSFYIPNLSTLADGMSPTQFKNILYEFLTDRNVEDLTNTQDALSFEYTYWPQPKNYTMILQEVVNMMSDYMFGTGLDEAMKYQTLYNKTFFYVFNYYSWNDYLPFYRGVANGQELQYMFGFPFINDTYRQITGVYPRQEYDYADRNMSEYMMSLWTNFTAFGDPTPRRFDLTFFKDVTWREYNLQNHSYLYISNSSSNLTNYRQKPFAFWKTYYPQLYNRPSLFTTMAPQESCKKEYQISTWSLTGVSTLLVIIVFALSIALYKRRLKPY